MILRYDFDYGNQEVLTWVESIFSKFLTYFSMVKRLELSETLLVTTIIPRESEQMKSTETSDLVLLKFLLRLATWIEEFFMNLLMLTFAIGMIIYFLEGPLVVIWMWGLGFKDPLMMLLIWSISLAPANRNVSLILIIFAILILYLEAWA